jgi:acetyl esterase/lipase
VQDLVLTVAGQSAAGLFTLPSGPPRGLVVFGHGYSHGADSWRDHMTKISRRDGVISVAMDYRGLTLLPRDSEGVLRSRGWPVKAGGEDLVAAAQHFDRQCPGLAQVILYGVSMGANATGMAMTLAQKRADGKRPLFDYWFAVEGVHNMPEVYQGARALAGTGNEFANNAYQDIEIETGGSFEAQPAAYAERSNVGRATDIAGAGPRGVVLVHAIEDGLAPYSQSQEMATRLREQGIPVDLYSVGRRGSDEPDTTLTGYTGNPGEYAGHGSEKSPTHIVIQTGFERLSAQLTKGDPAPCDREFRVDDKPQNVSPDPAAKSATCVPDPLPPAGSPADGACTDTLAPARVKSRVTRRGRRVTVSGRAADRGCGYVARVKVAVARVASHRCRFLRSRGGFGAARACTRRTFVSAGGTTAWRLKLPTLRRGRYELRAVAFDQGGRGSRLGPVSRFTIR